MKWAALVTPKKSLVTQLQWAFVYLISKYTLLEMQSGQSTSLSERVAIARRAWRLVSNEENPDPMDGVDFLSELEHEYGYSIYDEPQDDFDEELSQLIIKYQSFEGTGFAEHEAITDFLDGGHTSAHTSTFDGGRFSDPKLARYLEEIVRRKPRGLSRDRHIAGGEVRASLDTSEYGSLPLVVEYLDNPSHEAMVRRTLNGRVELVVSLHYVPRGSVHELKRYFSQTLRDTLLHEIVHLDQLFSQGSRGFPSKSREEIDDMHFTTSEFYSYLNNLTSEFLREHRNPTNEDIEDFVTIDADWFFLTLKEKDLRLYKKALGLFYEAVTRRRRG